MTRRAKRQKRVEGDFVQIDLGDGYHVYGRVLEEALFAFYDIRTTKYLDIDVISKLPILFQVPVMDYAVKRGRWVVIGNQPLDAQLLNPPPRFIQDQLRPDLFSIYQQGGIRPATREECIGLECEAVWDPEHIEDRLRDHYAGRPNKWVDSLRVK